MKLSNLYTVIQSPIGEIVLTSSNGAITGLYTEEHAFFKDAQKGTLSDDDFAEAIKQLNEYFHGQRKAFSLKLAPAGTEFQGRVWESLTKIDYGETKTYGDLAKLLNKPKASRAVGLANSKNPISILIPCHRVIGSNGKLTGYAGGLKAKKWLLEHENKI